MPLSSTGRRYVTAIATACALALPATIGCAAAVAGPMMPVEAGGVSKPAAKGDLTRPDSVSARTTARSSGERVEDLSQRTERAQTFANPDGSWTTEATAGPVRALDPITGEWHKIDTKLEKSDGDWKPAEAGTPIALSDGGAGPLVSMDDVDGHAMTWSWPTQLPSPHVNGATLTYVDAAPDADLVVTVVPGGFTYSVTLKHAPASAVEFPITVDTDGVPLRENEDGSLTMGPKKDPILSAPTPVMWDASAEGESTADADRQQVDVAVEHVDDATTMVLRPDQNYLVDPNTVYPVTVDPTWGTAWSAVSGWVRSSASGTSSSSGNQRDFSVSSGTGDPTTRSFLQFLDLPPLAGKNVLSAELQVYLLSKPEPQEPSTSNVTVQRVTQSWSPSTVSWANQPSSTPSGETSNSPSNFSGDLVPDYYDLTSIAQSWAAGSPNFGVRFAPTNESDTTDLTYAGPEYWQYPPQGYDGPGQDFSEYFPMLSLTWNTAPSVPSLPTVAPYGSFTPPGSGASTTYVGSTRPTFSAKSSDAEGDTVTENFEVSTRLPGSTSKFCTSSPVSSGATATCQLGAGDALTNGQAYFVRAKASDDLDQSSASEWYSFTVSDGTPNAPTVACSGQPNGAWTDSVPGGSVDCSISAPSDGSPAVGWIDYSIGNGTEVRTTITPSHDPNVAALHFTVPGTEGRRTIVARAESVTGIKSAATNYAFGFGTKVTLDSPNDGPPSVTTDRVRVSASGPPVSTGEGTPTVKMKWRTAGSGLDGGSGWSDAASGSASLQTSVTSSGSVTVTGTWNTATAVGNGIDARVPALFDVEVCIEYSAGEHCSWAGSQRRIMRVPSAFGENYPTVDVPNGQVALWTGEFHSSATDAKLAAGNTALSISRTASSFAGPAASTAAGVFGPGWIASLDGSVGGAGGMQVLDHTRSDGTIVVIDSEGSTIAFAPTGPISQRTGVNLSPGDWRTIDRDSIESGLTASVAGTGAGTTFTLVEPDGTSSIFAVATAPDANTDAIFAPDSVREPGAGTTTYSYAGGRVTRIVAPVPAGVTCPATAWTQANAGCRALTISYGTSSTAGISNSGDIIGQVKGISSVVATPSGVVETQLATYAYNILGHLTTVTDPRNGLSLKYSYDSNRISSISEPGLVPFVYEYAGDGNRLARVKRDRPNNNGTATIDTIVYDVPVAGMGGLPALDSTALERWGQTRVPTYAAAVFGPDRPVATLNPSQVAAGDWSSATIFYADARGYQLNTARYGAGSWQYSATEYDSNGSPTHSLNEGDTRAILSGAINPAAAGTLTIYNREHVNANGAITLAADSVVTDVYGPSHYVTLSDGSRALARQLTHTDFDQGAPLGGINPNSQQEFALPTTVTISAVDPASSQSLETESVTKTTYADAVSSDPDLGWKLGLPGSTTISMSSNGIPSANDIVSRTRYDALGRVIEQIQPKSSGNDAGTRKTAYYTSDGSGVTDCQSKPVWDGAICKVFYAGSASSGGLPTMKVALYNNELQPLSVTESANGVVRTTTTSYRSDGRISDSSLGLSGMPGSAIPHLSYNYDSSSGMPIGTSATAVAAGTGNGDPIVIGYDSWGRMTSYSAAAGETTTTSYDTAGRVASVVDPKGAATYTYDGIDASGNVEHRGLATKVEYTNSGGRAVSISGAYDASGALVRQNLPGGIVQRMTNDPAGEPIAMSYSGQVVTTDGVTSQDSEWVGWSQDRDVVGRVRRDWTPSGAALGATGTTGSSSGSGYARDYRYDRASRLTRVVDRTATGGSGGVNPDDPSAGAVTACRIREYAFDQNGNRISKTTTPAAADGSCQSSNATGVVAKSTTYDDADRVASTAYIYDALGRVTSLPQEATPAGASGGSPGAITMAYYDNDAVRAILQNGQKTSYTLDSAGRRVAATTRPVGGNPNLVVVRHYTDPTDSPGWTDTTVGGTTTTERTLAGLGGTLGVTVQQNGSVQVPIGNAHGDVVSQVTLPASGNALGLDAWRDVDEYGNPLTSGAAIPTSADGLGPAYGAYGQKGRETEATGLILMGARVYNPATGLFTSSDPKFGGNLTAYGYPLDPVNFSDLDGCKCGKKDVYEQVVKRTPLKWGSWQKGSRTAKFVAQMITVAKFAWAWVHAWGPSLDYDVTDFRNKFGTSVDIWESCNRGSTAYTKYTYHWMIAQGYVEVSFGIGPFSHSLFGGWLTNPSYAGYAPEYTSISPTSAP